MIAHNRQTADGRPHGRSRPSVTVVIPAYNAADTIARALDSACAQTYTRIHQVIVVDDGSTDATSAIVRQRQPGAILIQQDNRGPAAARNRGVGAAAGDYVAFLDADDEWLEPKLEVQMGVMARHPGLSLLTCACSGTTDVQAAVPAADTGPGLVRQIPFIDWLRRREWQYSTTTCFSGWVLSRDVFHALGGLDCSLRHSEDVEFLLRLTGRGFSAATITRPLYRYDFSRRSASNCPEGRLANASVAAELLATYEPSREGWQGEQLTAQEYAEARAGMHFRAGWSLWDAHLHKEARKHLALAAVAARNAGTLSWRHLAASVAPSLYRAMARRAR
jgi:glycosyltransferase involved in cell wall biosynthesis